MKRSEAILADLQDRTLTDTEIARRHGVSQARVSYLRSRAGIPRWRSQKPPRQRSPLLWTEDEVAYLIAHAEESVADVAAAIGRPVRAVHGMRYRLIKQGRIPRQRVPFTADELRLLADTTLTDAEVAERTGRS